MAGVANTVRLSARLASRYAPRSAQRGFHMARCDAAAQNYTMPALSPTMTEGNIAKWNIKEGDSFSAGDVLLEIETDKATMDVEAQDDGLVFKIVKSDGSKGIKVGDRIAVMAEQGDDLKSLEMPAEEATLGQQDHKAQAQEPSAPREEKSESKSKNEESKQTTDKESQSVGQEGKQTGSARSTKYPLYPSVETLLHQNGLSEKDAEGISATGPQGRLLKGDVLAYLGKISKEYPAESSKRLEKLSHLDLSNIQLAPKTEKPSGSKQAEKPAALELPQVTEVAIPISLSQLIATQRRVTDTLGIHVPLSTLIARASEMANEDLPLSKNRKPTSDELFNSILGIDQVARASKGNYFPQITGISPAPVFAARPAKKADIIDILSAPKAKTTASIPGIVPAGISAGDNIFSVLAKPGEESRASEYLGRMKLVLENEPGRLVL